MCCFRGVYQIYSARSEWQWGDEWLFTFQAHGISLPFLLYQMLNDFLHCWQGKRKLIVEDLSSSDSQSDSDTAVNQKGKKPVQKKSKTNSGHAKAKGEYKRPQEGISGIPFWWHTAHELKYWYELAKCQTPWTKESCRREQYWRDFDWGGVWWWKCR